MSKKPHQQVIPLGMCADWETSGAVYNQDSSIKFQGLTLGVVIFNTETFEEVDHLYLEIKFNQEKYQWLVEAERIHGKSREYLEEHGIEQEEAAITLLEFIYKHFNNSKVLFCGHNPEFDRRFTNQLLKTVDFEFSSQKENPSLTQIELYHFMIDTSALGFATVGLYKSDLLFEHMGFDKRGAHNALDDARMTVQTCAILKQLTSLGYETIVNE